MENVHVTVLLEIFEEMPLRDRRVIGRATRENAGKMDHADAMFELDKLWRDARCHIERKVNQHKAQLDEFADLAEQKRRELAEAE